MTGERVDAVEEPEPSAIRRRGRPPVITFAQVVEAAAEIGIEHLTLQAVADHLGVTRAALYHYVASIDDLRRIVAHHLLPEFDAMTGHHASWQEWLAEFAALARDWRLRNADLVSGDDHVAMMDLPSMALVVDQGIGVLEQAGFPPARSVQVLQFIGGLVWVNTQDELVAARSPGGRHPQAVEIGASVERADLELRHLTAELAARAFRDPEARFRREIDWAITALESELAHLRRSRLRPDPT
jgi:AcrR family transcriptional regulator